MTDNENIKGLKCFCPMSDSECVQKCRSEAINRLKAEIEKKTTECERLEIYMAELVEQRINQAKVEAIKELMEKVNHSKEAYYNYEEKAVIYIDEVEQYAKELMDRYSS